MPKTSDVFYRVYRDTADDYFRRLGGAGRYKNYSDWHPLALTICVGLRAFDWVNVKSLDDCLLMLPRELTQGSDHLAKALELAFSSHMEKLSDLDSQLQPQEIWEMWTYLKAGETGFLLDDFDTILRKAMFPK
jgi:hypothetical protein